MKELKRTVTREEVYGYEANDGKLFNSKEECEKYENSANIAIWNNFQRLFIKEQMSECQVFENYGYGSEEYQYAVLKIKNADDVRIANQYLELIKENHPGHFFTSEDVGKTILCGIGYCYDKAENKNFYRHGTIDELCAKFRKDMEKVFEPERKEI